MSFANDGQQQPTIGPIQVIPPGLTGYLQLKQTGRLPSQVSETVRPVLELRDWYYNRSVVNELAAFNTNALISTQAALTTAAGIGIRGFYLTGGVLNAQVPLNQLWYVWQMSIYATTALAADVFSFFPVLFTSAVAPNSFVQVGQPYVDTVTARNRAMAVTSSGPFWAQPADIFAIGVIDISTAGISPALHLRVTVLPL